MSKEDQPFPVPPRTGEQPPTEQSERVQCVVAMPQHTGQGGAQQFSAAGGQGGADLSLVTQVAVFHNKRAFDKLVMKYQSPIRRFFLGQTLGDEQLSDDLAQDTFIKAYTNIGQFRGMSSFSTWLYRIAYNVFYDYNRGHHLTEDIDQPAVARRHSEQIDCGLRMDLMDALAILSPAERTCITLQLMEGQPINKIAEVTGMTEGTIKSHLSRGKQKLCNYLKKNGYDRK